MSKLDQGSLTYISIIHDDLMSLIRDQWRMFTILWVDIVVQICHHICENIEPFG